MFRKLHYLFYKSHYISLYKNRCQEILDCLTEIFTIDQPYVKNGFWSWFVVDKIQQIPIVYPEIPLLIEIEKYQIGSWDTVKKYCKDKIEWESLNKVHNGLLNIASELEIPILNIELNDPINKESLKTRLIELLSKQ